MEKKITYSSGKVLVYCLTGEEGEPYLIHNYDEAPGSIVAASCFILPCTAGIGGKSYCVRAKQPFQIELNREETEVVLTFESEDGVVWENYDGFPNCDIMGNSMELDFQNGELFLDTLYHFYWGTLLPSVVERTRARSYPDRDGYVVSTLHKEAYAGTYPDVDHEFQVKGRIAMGSELDLAVVGRMLKLQLRMMEEDPESAYRDPCAVQPDGTREYHVRRNSLDGSENAEMFLVTGNIEIIEAAWFYYAASKNRTWLEEQVEGLENSLSLVESCIDRQGRLWSDVYYEDQVIKDGRECMAAALAADAFEHLAQLERVLGRAEREEYYRRISGRLAAALTADLPTGFWDSNNRRFIDWVDRNSRQHDHIHLLANELPVLFRYAKPGQTEGVDRLMEEYFSEFQRFPSFVAARIEDYTDAEIGSGGPYDLCAAGRYWCWDFAYWLEKDRKDVLEHQLVTVCKQAESDGYRMGERYDMNHVYYQSDKNWHGAAHYYEYPCVYIWNLISGYLGLKFTIHADLEIKPMLNVNGRVRLENPLYGIEYRMDGDYFSLTNLLNCERSYIIHWKNEERQVCVRGNETYTWNH